MEKRFLSYKQVLILFSLIANFNVHSQENTVGVLTYDKEETFDGYNLIYPNFQSDVFLIDNCGQVIHRWTDEESNRPGNSAYILNDGTLLKTKRPSSSPVSSFSNGGAGGIIELRSWDNDIIWSKTILDSLERAHHDIEPMPNGNILVIAWERIFKEELIAAGRDTTLIPNFELWPDFIREYNPYNDSIVWEWHAWDHIVQDFDATKENYGIVSEHPELIDINYDLNFHGGRPDFMHSNSIDYNPELDQILLSVAFFDEIWIIDHSTTTDEAASHSGGNMNMGGDLLYRWGNPRAYKSGTQDDQKLFFQHDAEWITDPLLASTPYYNDIIVFNNRVSDDHSSINILNPNPGNYQGPDRTYPPENFSLSLTHPIKENLYSTSMSSVQYLPNENFLICSSRSGYSFEMNIDQEIFWEYKLPLSNGFPISQGDQVLFGNNMHFRIDRYPIDFSGFEGKNFTNYGYLELNPSQEFCDLTDVQDVITPHVELFPNPSYDREITITGADNQVIDLYDSNGSKEISFLADSNRVLVDLSHMRSGLYIVKFGSTTKKLILF
jgi:hypothetical protein